MKKSFYVLLAAILLLGVYSCSDDNIGSSIDDSTSSVIKDSAFTLTGSSVLNQHIQSRTITQLLGIINAKGYGKLTSDVVTQFMPTIQVDTTGTKVGWIDSCRIALRIPRGGFTGDSLVPMRLNIYRLKKQLPNPIYSDFSPSGYYSKGDLLGTASYSANALEKGDTVNSYSYRTVYVKMPLSLATDMFNKFKEDPSVFNNPTAFANYFPGIYISNSYGSGRVMNFYDTELEVFYKKHVQLTDSTDTIYPAITQSYLAATAEIVTNNNINLEVDPSVKNLVANGNAVVMSPAGYDVKVKLPIQEIINHYKSNIKSDLSVVNSVEVQIPVDTIINQYDLQPPKYLLLIKTSKKDQFFAGDSLVNNKTSFYATYNTKKRVYLFSGLRAYMLDILNNHGGVATDDDTDFTIMPIDMSFYTSTATYYTSSTTSVTKIAPAVSTPSLAILDLPKTKIMLTYSKQTVH